jgi:hypothetical protein
VEITSSRTPRLLGLLAAVALLGSVLAATPASAAPVKPGGAGAMRGHCVAILKPGVNKAPALHCFSTFTRAISYATGGLVTDAPAKATASAALSAKLEAANAAAPQAAAPTLAGIEYSDPNFTGWTLTMSVTSACTLTTTDVDYSLDLPSPIWDQISSYTNTNVCFTDHYYLSNFGNPHTGFLDDAATMPSMNVDGGPFNGDNNTRSIAWS